MVSNELKNIIGIRAMDVIVIIGLGLKKHPCSRSYNHKGFNSKKRYLGKLASPCNRLFGIVFKLGLFLEGDNQACWKIHLKYFVFPYLCVPS